MGELSRPSKIGLGVGLGIFLAGAIVLILYFCGVFNAPITPTPTKVLYKGGTPIIINGSETLSMPSPNDTFPVTVPNLSFANGGFPGGCNALIVKGTPVTQLMNYPCFVDLSLVSNTTFTAQILSCNNVQTPPDVGYPIGVNISLVQAPASIAVCQINGLPAIAFHGTNSSNSNYQFLSATNTAGTTWETPNSNLFPVNSTGNAEGVTLTLISGYPSMFTLMSATEIYYARSTNGAYDFTQNTQFMISNGYTSLQGPISTYVNYDGYLVCACFSMTGSIAMTYAITTNPASPVDFSIIYVGTSLTRCACMNIIYRFPCYFSVDSSGNIILGLSTSYTPTSNSYFSAPVIIVPANLGHIPNANSIIRMVTLYGRPMVVWISGSTIYYTICNDNFGVSWSLTATNLDPLTLHVTFDVVTLASGAVGVAFVTSDGYVKYAFIDGSGKSIVTHIGTNTTNIAAIGVGVINSIPAICFSRGTSAYFISAGANNENFYDSITMNYEAAGY